MGSTFVLVFFHCQQFHVDVYSRMTNTRHKWVLSTRLENYVSDWMNNYSLQIEGMEIKICNYFVLDWGISGPCKFSTWKFYNSLLQILFLSRYKFFTSDQQQGQYFLQSAQQKRDLLSAEKRKRDLYFCSSNERIIPY